MAKKPSPAVATSRPRTAELGTDQLVVLGERLFPGPVAGLGGSVGRAHPSVKTGRQHRIDVGIVGRSPVTNSSNGAVDRYVLSIVA